MDDNNSGSDQKRNDKQYVRTVEKLSAVRAVKRISNPNSEWNLTQEIFQEIQASYIVKDPEKLPKTTQLVEDLKKEIEIRYADDEEMKTLLLDSIPETRSVRLWLKKKGWDDAVWKKVRGDRLFSPDKRAQVIEALRERAIHNSDSAAKIWLQLSGDLVDKVEVNNKSIDTYREINSILHRKKVDNSE